MLETEGHGQHGQSPASPAKHDRENFDANLATLDGVR